MFGGLLKSTSLAALVAVAGVAISGVSAQAADLGGNCCADLEERIAELEATTARKGNRKVSLTVSGQVNEAVLAWDDGVETNAYVTTNEVSRSRFRFLGSAKIDAKWSAGYLMEIGVRGNKGNDLGQNTSSTGKGLDVRHSAWYLKNADLGTVWLGQTSNSADGITEVNLANVGHFAGPSQVGLTLGGFKLRNAAGAQSTNAIKALITGGPDGSNPGDGSRYNLVKYETPVLAGFIGSASWGEDDQWDVALRYAGEFSGFKLAAGVAYHQSNDGTTNPRSCAKVGGAVDCNELGLSASVMHVPTGLFLSGAYGYRDDNNRKLLIPTSKGSKDEFWMAMGGIEQAFFPLGKTTVFGSYYDGAFAAPGTTAGITDANLGLGTISGVDAQVWGLGLNQNISAAAMDLYVMYNNYQFDVKSGVVKANTKDIDTVIAGARIQF